MAVRLYKYLSEKTHGEEEQSKYFGSMFLKLNHHHLDICKTSRLLTIRIYQLTREFPSEEKFVLIPQIRRAVISTYLNISEGCSRKSIQERKRFFEIARSSLVELDAALDISNDLGYCNSVILNQTSSILVRTFSMISKMIHSS